MISKEMLSYDYDLYFEPNNPITNPKEFSNELIRHFSCEKKFITIIEESMTPIIEIDDKRYVCKLGKPFSFFKPLKYIKFPLNPNSLNYLGYKWVYIYKC